MFIDLFSRRCNLKSVEFSEQFIHLKTLPNLHYLFCPWTQFVLVSGKNLKGFLFFYCYIVSQWLWNICLFSFDYYYIYVALLDILS